MPTSGWIGRWLDGYLGGRPTSMRLPRSGTRCHSIWSVRDHAARSSRAAGRLRRRAPQPRDQRIVPGDPGDVQPWQRSVAGGRLQAFVDQLDLAGDPRARVSSTRCPTSRSSARLEVTARLINANLGFRVFTAGWGDFDSHANQPDDAPTRMAELNAAHRALLPGARPCLGEQGHGDDLLGVRPHELGQRRRRHRPRHRGAAPRDRAERPWRHLRPAAAPHGLRQWDRMAHPSTSARTTHRSSTAGWAGVGSTVLGGNYENLGLFARGPGINADGSTAPCRRSCHRRRRSSRSTRSGCSTPATATGGVIDRPMNPGEAIRVPIAGVGLDPGVGVTAVAANVDRRCAPRRQLLHRVPGHHRTSGHVEPQRRAGPAGARTSS